MDERVVLIGAGSASFTRGLLADVIRQGWRGEVALVDVDPDALAVAERLARKMIEARRAPLTLRASTDRREVLKRATAVICTIGVGGRRGGRTRNLWGLLVQAGRRMCALFLPQSGYALSETETESFGGFQPRGTGLGPMRFAALPQRGRQDTWIRIPTYG